MQKPLHLQAVANVDKTKASRKCSLTEEYSHHSHAAVTESDEEFASEHHADEDTEFLQSVYQTILSECRFASQENLSRIPRFSRNEIVEGLTLGKGSFGTIQAVAGFSLRTKQERYELNMASSEFEYEESIKGGEMESKHFIARHCFRSNGHERYALKRLQRRILDDNDFDYLRGMTDLANETLFLGSIDHPHIIKLRGIGAEGVCSRDFFIILDRLYETLSSRLIKWKAEEKKISGLKRIFRKRVSITRKGLLTDRLNYASQLASALVYLHHHKIIHRDLKPKNIGFDVRGDIKIFDFGLARELPRKPKRSSCKTFNLTMNAGTPRYMAPEVATGKYNEVCDIYSTGLLLWEFMTLKRPFKDQKSVEDFEQNVWCPNGPQCRPKVSAKVSPGLQRLLTRSWSHCLADRPSAAEFENTLRSEISKLEDNSSEGEMDSELYSSAPSNTSNNRRFAFLSLSMGKKRHPTSLPECCIQDGAFFDLIGTSTRTFLTKSYQSDMFQSFRSEGC